MKSSKKNLVVSFFCIIFVSTKGKKFNPLNIDAMTCLFIALCLFSIFAVKNC